MGDAKVLAEINTHTGETDALLRAAGYDPEKMRGLKTPAVLASEADTRRRQRWAAGNRLKGNQRQVGLSAPTPPVAVDRGSSSIGAFAAGLLLGKLL